MKLLSQIKLFASAVALVLLTSGCSWFGVSDEQQRLQDGASRPVEIPEGLDQPPFQDLMPIPDVVDYRGLSGQPLEVGLPQPLSTSFGVEQIVIRKLGDERWVFLDLPTATIWPQVVLFWEENNLPIARQDPRLGILESEWIGGDLGNPDEIYESLKSRRVVGARQYKFRVRIEPGVRNGSSELYVQQIERPFGSEENPAWPDGSQNPELEGKVLSEMAYFLGDRMAQGPSVSLLAAGLQESKATLETTDTGLVLTYRLNFDRAWATVGDALENARVNVEDLDRTAAKYFVYYDARHDPDPGFLKRLFSFGGDDKDDAPSGHRYTIQLASEGEQNIKVTVALGDQTGLTETEDLILRERLLKLIREYST